MPWDLTPDEASKVKRLLRGESVDLTPDEATKFKPIAMEAKARQQSKQPSLSEQAMAALKEVPGMFERMVTPDPNAITSNTTSDLQFKALAGMSAFDVGAQHFMNPLERSDSPQQMAEQTRRSAENVDMMLEEGRKRNPKLALAAGVLAPFPTKIKEQMLVAGGLGALHGYTHAQEGEGLQGALVGGGVNALLAGGLGLGMKGAGKVLGPATKALLKRLNVKLPGMDAEVKTAVETPLDVMAREQAGMNARAGEPPTVVETPPNLREPWFGPDADPALTKAGAGANTRPSFRMPQPEPGTAPLPLEAPTRGSARRDPLTKTSALQQLIDDLNAEPRTDVLPEPGGTVSGRRPGPGEPTVVDRPMLHSMNRKAQRTPEGRAPDYSEPVTETGPLRPGELSDRARRMLGSGKLPGEPTTDVKLGKVRDLLAERPTTVDDPRLHESLVESGFYEAADAAERGNPELMLKWLGENPQGGKTAEAIGLSLAKDHRAAYASKELTKPLKTETPRDVMGTKAASPRAGERSLSDVPPDVDKGLAWLSGEDIGTDPTQVKYVPRDVNAPRVFGRDPEVTHVPQGRAPGPEMFIGGGSGTPPRAAAATQSGPPVSIPLQPQHLPANYFQLAQASKELLNKSDGWGAKLWRALKLPEHRGSELLGHAVLSFKASQALGEMRVKHFFPKMEAALKELPVSTRTAVKETIRKLRDRQATAADVASLPEKFRNLFEQAQNEQNAQLKELARGGYFSGVELAGIVSNMRKGWLYAHRSYHAFTSPKTWDPDVKAMDQAAKFFMKGDKSLSYENAQVQVRALVKAIRDPNKSGLRGAEMLTALLRDKGMVKGRTLPPQLRPLLGVIDDPSFIAADTAGHMASMFHLMARTRALLAPEYQGKVWSDVPAPHLDERPLWVDSLSPAGNKRLFGELAGKYVDPALREAMTEAPPPVMEEVASQFVKKINSWFAMSKVLTSPTTWARNFLSNGLYLAASGLANPVRQAQYVGKAMKALYASASKGVGAKEAGASELVQMAIEDGALRLGRGTDFAGGSEARRIVELALAKKHDGLLGMMDNVFRAFTKKQGQLGDAYEFFDQSARLAAYLYHLEQGRKTLGMSPVTARAHASHVVNRYFATGAGVPPALARFKQYTLGAAPFMNWFVDNTRVALNIAADAAQGRVAPLMRAAAWSAIPFMAFKGAQIWNGFTDEDRAAAERATKPSWDAEHAFTDVLPVKRADGTMYVVSFDGLNPMSAFFKGGDAMNPAQRVASSVAMGLVDSGALESWVDRKLGEAGVKPEEYRPKTLHGDEGWALARGISDFMQPQLMNQFRNVARKAQLDIGEPLRPQEEPQSLAEALLTQFSPVSIEKVGPRTERAAKKQLRGERSGLMHERSAAKKIQDPERRQRVLDGVRGALEDFRDRFRNR